MEQYLLDLIKNNNRVIVPNFGAFIISRDAGTTVLFNNFLSFNDGLLINHISHKEGIDTNEATQRVSDFVDHVKQELDKKGEYTIEKLGTFTKDQSGILRFTQNPHVSGLIPDKEEVKDDSALLDIDSEASEDAEEKKPSEETKKTPPPVSKDKPLHDPQKKSSFEKKTADSGQKTHKAEKPIPPKERKKVTPSMIDEGGKRSKFPPWAIALIILIPLIILLLYIFYWSDQDQEKEVTAEKTEIVDTLVVPEEVDSAAIKKAKEDEIKKIQAEEEAKQQATIRKHHIIVGGFKNETNAKKLVNELKSKGFEEATTFTRDNLVLVSAASYESLPKARKAQERFLNQHQMENWILTRK